jgi:hypothetical protein
MSLIVPSMLSGRPTTRRCGRQSSISFFTRFQSGLPPAATSVVSPAAVRVTP